MPVPWLPGSHLIVLSELLLFYPVSAGPRPPLAEALDASVP